MGPGISGTNDHVVAFVEFGKQWTKLPCVVLTIAIHERDDVALRSPCACFYSGAVAEAFRVPHDLRPCAFSDARRIVSRTVVDNDDLGLWVFLNSS